MDTFASRPVPFLARRPAPSRLVDSPGQALVEFVLVVPILIILLLGIADFGRIFAAGIAMQAASRDGAEAGAQTYTQVYSAPGMTSATLYSEVRQRAMAVACSELEGEPGVEADSTYGCTVAAVDGRMPAIALCVHDAAYVLTNGVTEPGDPDCGAASPSDVTDAAYFAQNCASLLPGSSWNTSVDSSGLPFVEVRLCYRFDMLTNAPAFFHLGPTFLQQSSNFVVAAY